MAETNKPTETEQKTDTELPALRVKFIEYGRVYNLREHRNERIRIGADVDATQMTEEQGMILLFEKVECLHGAFQHWRNALGQVYAAESQIEAKKNNFARAKENVEDLKRRAKDLEDEGKSKRAECALEDLDTLEARVAEAKQSLEDVKLQYHQAVQTKDEIANCLRNGAPGAALGIPLDPTLTSYDIEVIDRYHRDFY